MEKNYWKIGVLILIFFGLVVAGTLAVQKLKVPLGQPAKAQAEPSKKETAEPEKPKQESENTEPKKELKKEEPKRAVPTKTPRKEAPKKEPKKYLRQKRMRFRLNLQWESPLPIGIKKLLTGP